MQVVAVLTFLIVACAAGFYATRAVPSPPHPVLMAMTGVIGAIILIGALIAVAETSVALSKYLGMAAILLTSAAVCGGWVVAERLLAAARNGDRG